MGHLKRTWQNTVPLQYFTEKAEAAVHCGPVARCDPLTAQFGCVFSPSGWCALICYSNKHSHTDRSMQQTHIWHVCYMVCALLVKLRCKKNKCYIQCLNSSCRFTNCYFNLQASQLKTHQSVNRKQTKLWVAVEICWINKVLSQHLSHILASHVYNRYNISAKKCHDTYWSKQTSQQEQQKSKQ